MKGSARGRRGGGRGAVLRGRWRLGSSEEELLELLAPDVCVTEHPNAITPRGAILGRDEVIRGFHAGKALLSAQSFEIHGVLETGERVAVRATWRGTVKVGSERLAAGTELVAHIAALLTVVDGRIREHETFDCYEPF